MEVSIPTLSSGLSYKAIAEYADKVGKHHNIYDGNGNADLQKLLTALGGRIHYSKDVITPEASRIKSVGDFEIIIPPLESARRDRFTIAHEIGHYFLHYLYPKETRPVTFRRGESNLAETEANVFASSLLMPEDKFKELFDKVSDDWWAISENFEVSPNAARVRAQVLNLVATQ